MTHSPQRAQVSMATSHAPVADVAVFGESRETLEEKKTPRSRLQKVGDFLKSTWNAIKTGFHQIGTAIRRRPVKWALFLGAVAVSFVSVAAWPVGAALVLANGFGWLDKFLGMGDYYQEA